VNALLVRREKIGRAYIEGVTPLDLFTVGPAGLCAVDLGTFYGLAHGGNVEHLDHEGRVLESRVIAADGRVCVAQPRARYEAVRLRVRRLDEAKPPMQVHVVDGARIVGIVRSE
jgi:hypothetical protein